MIMMARAQGIPARMAIGFLPGQLPGRALRRPRHRRPRVARALLPGLRLAALRADTGRPRRHAPAVCGARRRLRRHRWRPPGHRVGLGGARPAGRPDDDPAAAAPVPQQQGFLAWLGARRSPCATSCSSSRCWSACSRPSPCRSRPGSCGWRRRRAAVTQQDLIEAEWDDLTSHLGDLGLGAPEGVTLRQLRERYVIDGHLDEENATAMRRVTATLEKSRYDRPERTTPQEAVPAAPRHPVDPASGRPHPCLAGPGAVLLLARGRCLLLALASRSPAPPPPLRDFTARRPGHEAG